MMISKEKLDKIKSIGTDSADLILKINDYLEYKYCYFNSDNVVEKIDDIDFNNVELALLFETKGIEPTGVNAVKIENVKYEDSKKINSYYAGKEYESKINFYKKWTENFDIELLSNREKIVVVLDISSISSYPLWNTLMRRRMNDIAFSVNCMELEQITEEALNIIIQNSKREDVNFENNKYDVDFVMEVLLKLVESANIVPYFIDSEKTNESRFIVSELQKFIYAITLEKDEERYQYIYDVICKDMDEIFSKFAFCNFKNDSCVAQRHKNLFSRYPVPKTDGCCFKVVRKCEHNNKDGTCKVKCLPCKIFTCPYLSKIDIGVMASELMLMRRLLNNRQKRTLIYKFYTPEEVLLKRVNAQK